MLDFETFKREMGKLTEVRSVGSKHIPYKVKPIDGDTITIVRSTTHKEVDYSLAKLYEFYTHEKEYTISIAKEKGYFPHHESPAVALLQALLQSQA